MFEQVAALVAVGEKQALQDLVHVLVAALDLALRGGEVSIDDDEARLAEPDGAADCALVAAHAEDSRADLSELVLGYQALHCLLEEYYLEEAHLHVARQLLHKYGAVWGLQLPPVEGIKLPYQIPLPLLRLLSRADHRLCIEWHDLLEVEEQKVWNVSFARYP